MHSALLLALVIRVVNAEHEHALVRAQAMAYALASMPTCSALFPAGVDPVLVLQSQVYKDSWVAYGSDAPCLVRDAAALTPLGSDQVTICESFYRQSFWYQVATLIHEAMHSCWIHEEDVGSRTFQLRVIDSCIPESIRQKKEGESKPAP